MPITSAYATIDDRLVWGVLRIAPAGGRWGPSRPRAALPLTLGGVERLNALGSGLPPRAVRYQPYG